MQATEELSTVRSHDTPLPHSGDRWLVQGVFFAGFLAYVWLLIDPRLIYDAFGIYLPYPEFSLDGACLREALSRAAGPLDYLSAFLSQWFSASHVGALIVTAAAGLICVGTERLVRESREIALVVPEPAPRAGRADPLPDLSSSLGRPAGLGDLPVAGRGVPGDGRPPTDRPDAGCVSGHVLRALLSGRDRVSALRVAGRHLVCVR